MSAAPRLFGVLAEFETPSTLYHACEAVRDHGFVKWDAHTPFPVHGLENAMGIGRSHVPWLALVGGLTGAAGAFALQAWVSTSAYEMVISGKPMLSWQAFVPVTFEVGVLCGAAGALIGMLALSLLPRHHHPLFGSARFERFSDDRFFISIESGDPQFDPEKCSAMLRELGASHVELVEEAA